MTSAGMLRAARALIEDPDHWPDAFRALSALRDVMPDCLPPYADEAHLRGQPLQAAVLAQFDAAILLAETERQDA